jgi:two-component system, NtrC family, nitrogen regulation sensor histidine kinase NtrY
MQETGRIEVATNWDREKGVIRLAVADEGCGIDEAVYSQLFEPYFSTKQGGTGLGLAIVQRIVNDHGGFVRVTANRPRGTRFTLEFPETLRVDPGHRPLARAAEKGSERAL